MFIIEIFYTLESITNTNEIINIKTKMDKFFFIGKKSTDRKEQIELLHELQAVADQHKLGAAVAVKIKFSIVTAIFDYNPRVSDAMKPEYWSK